MQIGSAYGETRFTSQLDETRFDVSLCSVSGVVFCIVSLSGVLYVVRGFAVDSGIWFPIV